MEKEIGSVEDTYTVKDEYNSITSKLPLLDDGELRASLLEKVESRYDYFKEIIAGMSDEISRYEAVQAEEKKQAQEQAAKDAEAKRAQEEKAVKKQTFMQALERIENLEYQETDAEDLVSDAIDKLSLVAGDDEEASFLQGSRLPSPVSPLFQRKVSGMLPRLKKRRKKPRKKARLKCRYNPSSVSCAPL